MATSKPLPRCPVCRAQLRRTKTSGSLCDPCQAAGHSPRLELPATFYADRTIQSVVGNYDFGALFLQVRGLTGCTQGTLGEITGLGQARVSQIERGVHRLRDIQLVAGVVRGLRIPSSLLKFGSTATVIAGADGRTSWVDRRDFIADIAALAFAAAGSLDIDVERLIALLYPDTESDDTGQIGVADVAAIEHATAGFEQSNFTLGGGAAREAAVAQLQAALPLLGRPMAEDLAPRLHIAITHLAVLAGWMSMDVDHHDAARRLWSVGLEIARATDHPHTTDLTAHLLFVMAQQALYLRRPDEASRLVQIGTTVGVGAHPLTQSTLTCLATNAAFAHAARGELDSCRRALGDAEDSFGRIDPADTTPWACVDGEVKITTWQGHAYYELGRATGNRRCIDKAVTLLRRAVDNPRPMSRALYLPDLTGAHALAGDVDTAVALGHQAVDTVAAMSSRRLGTRLQVLNAILDPLGDRSDVVELRERLTAA
jgi:transcriptional regulator with XRE-family HTH domain